MQLFIADAITFFKRFYFCPRKHKKLPWNVAYSWQFGFFSLSLQPRPPKTAQEWILIFEMCLKTHLFSNLWGRLIFRATGKCQKPLGIRLNCAYTYITHAYNILEKNSIMAVQCAYNYIYSGVANDQHNH